MKKSIGDWEKWRKFNGWIELKRQDSFLGILIADGYFVILRWGKCSTGKTYAWVMVVFKGNIWETELGGYTLRGAKTKASQIADEFINKGRFEE